MPSPTSWSGAANVSLTGLQEIDALLSGTKWANTAVTYSFPGYGASWSTSTTTGYGPSNSGSEPWSPSFAPVSDIDQTAFSLVLQQWDNPAGLQFLQVADTPANVGDIRAAFSYQSSLANAQAWATSPGSSSYAGDIWFNSIGSSANNPWTAGSYSYFAALHEIGHALGLKHPFYEAGSASTILSAALDSQSYTVMSYSAKPGDATTSFSFYPTTPMLLDIQAIQSLYGADYSHHAGDDIYTYTDAATYHETIWDGGGSDTIRYSGYRDAAIDLRAGHGSQIGTPVYIQSAGGANLYAANNIWVAYGVTIENAIGGQGNDTLTGNAANNILEGNAGNDTALFSAAYTNCVITYSGNLGGYRVASLADGVDLVYGVETFAFADQSIAASNLNLAASIAGGAGNDRLAGSAGSHIIDGGGGLDTVAYAGARSGFDIARFGTGYLVSDRNGVEGVGELINVERLVFADSQVALDIDGAAGQAYRLYQATFNRAPDIPGLTNWVAHMDAGMALTQVAGLFTQSDEFRIRYGSQPADADFITALYANTLHRMPDPGGFEYWANQLTALVMTRPEVLVGFSESAENYVNVVGAIQNGITLDLA